MKLRGTVFFCYFALAILSTILAAPRIPAAENPFHFEYDIAPHLARAGCAAAECHGGATGRGGFKLSLFATNPRADFEAITQDLDGRRVSYLQPDHSLIVRKPTKQMKHGGGRMIDTDSPTHAALSKWIRAGTPFATGESGKLKALGLALDKGRLTVKATFELPDGSRRSRDVTALARFESTDDRIAAVDENGTVLIGEPGEAWLVARYGELAARLALLQPYLAKLALSPQTPEPVNPLDRVWLARLAVLHLEPAPPATPHQLLRRFYFDLTGRPPTPDEISAFFALPEASRVEQTVGRLLHSDEFADQLARHLGSWFEVPPPEEDLKHTNERNARLRAGVRKFAGSDESLAEFARAMFVQPARREFIQRFGDPRDRAEFTARTLLGINISCARCHNHPLDRWSQAQHLQFSAFFTDQRPAPSDAGGGGAETTMRMAAGKFFLPGDGKAITPALLPIGSLTSAGGTATAADGSEEARRARLAQFVTRDAADALARNAANRIFGVMLGRHLVDSPDDHRLSNPAVHEPVMALLSEQLRSHGYQLRPLVQLIATSQLYAAGSQPPDPDNLSGDPQLRYLARREARSMTGAQFRRALELVLGVALAAVETPSTPLTQQLHLLNSGIVQRALQTPGNQVDAIFDFETDAARQLEQLFLLVLSRPPSGAEQHEFLPLLGDPQEARAAGKDLAFALIASREFASIR